MFKSSKKNGMTVVETLVYIAILAFLFFMVVETLTTIARTYRATAVTRSLSSSGMTALDRISRDIRNATSVDQVRSVLNGNPGKLVLINGATTTEFYVEDGLISIRENGVSKGSLTLGSATTTNLIFRLITTPKSSAVKIEMSLQSGEDASLRVANFYNTVVLRNSY